MQYPRAVAFPPHHSRLVYLPARNNTREESRCRTQTRLHMIGLPTYTECARYRFSILWHISDIVPVCCSTTAHSRMIGHQVQGADREIRRGYRRQRSVQEILITEPHPLSPASHIHLWAWLAVMGPCENAGPKTSTTSSRAEPIQPSAVAGCGESLTRPAATPFLTALVGKMTLLKVA